jgi:uncharacterized glyoxalase superfamily protein PhnB
MTHAPAVFPLLAYRNGDRALELLTTGLGFTAHDVTRDDDNQIVHAVLFWRTGGVMLTAYRDGAAFALSPVGLYVVVEDPDAHFARAVAAGLQIVQPLTDQPYGSREFAGRDFEGNMWSFGTYAPEAPVS